MAPSQATILMTPPGIQIQNPPAVSYVTAQYPGQPDHAYPGSTLQLAVGYFHNTDMSEVHGNCYTKRLLLFLHSKHIAENCLDS